MSLAIRTTSSLLGDASVSLRITLSAALSILVPIAACTRGVPPTAEERADAPGPDVDDPGDSKEKRFARPNAHLIRYACLGFDAAVADGAPPDRLLSYTAARAIELGGAPVEAATQRWALLPPQGLLEEIERYEHGAGVNAENCAGLRAHLEHMAILSSSH